MFVEEVRGLRAFGFQDPELPALSSPLERPRPKSKSSRFAHAQPISILEVPEAWSLVLLGPGSCNTLRMLSYET